MQTELVTDEAQFRRLDQFLMRHAHRMNCALNLMRPEIEKFFKLGKFRR